MMMMMSTIFKLSVSAQLLSSPITPDDGDQIQTLPALIKFSRAMSCRETSFIVTGSTGVLGKSILQSILLAGHPLMAIHRSDDKWKRFCDELNLEGFDTSRIDARNVDVSNEDAIANMCLQLQVPTVLINNAAVYSESTDVEAYLGAMEINSMGPAILAEKLIKGITSDQKLSIINVSSGDGEMIYLNTQLQMELNKLTNLEDWKAFVRREHEWMRVPGYEVAATPSPAYALSKALLNVFTRLLHAASGPNVRVLSVCPGNFASPMSTADELLSACDPLEAAGYVLRAGLDWDAHPGGRFYRYGEEIPF